MRAGVIQQLAPTEQIYNDPANLFVAGFIGSPPMNLLPGALEDGVFVAPRMRIEGAGVGNNPAVALGVRPEDVHLVTPGEGDADGSVYTFELTGEAILVAADVQVIGITARGDRHLRFAVNENVGLRINRDHLFRFDAGTEQRLRH